MSPMEFHKNLIKFVIGIAFLGFLVLILSGCSPAPEVKEPTIEFRPGKNVQEISYETGLKNSLVDETIVYVTRIDPQDSETIVYLWLRAGVYKYWNLTMEPNQIYPAIKVEGLKNEGAYAVLQKYNDSQYKILGYTRDLTVVNLVDPALALTAP